MPRRQIAMMSASVTNWAVIVALGGMLILTSIAVAFQRRLIKFARECNPMEPQRKVSLTTVLLGATIGITVSLTSVGTGAIGVTALLMLYPNLPLKRIAGTDIAHAVPLAVVGGFGHWVIGDVNMCCC